MKMKVLPDVLEFGAIINEFSMSKDVKTFEYKLRQ